MTRSPTDRGDAAELDGESLTSSELAPILMVAPRSLYNWAHGPLAMPHYLTAGGQLRFKARDVRNWMRQSAIRVPEALDALCGPEAA